jgi:hypothetical protein
MPDAPVTAMICSFFGTVTAAPSKELLSMLGIKFTDDARMPIELELACERRHPESAGTLAVIPVSAELA